MYSSSIVLLHSDASLTRFLTASLRNEFRAILSVQSLEDLRSTVASSRAQVVILDIETASLADVERLSKDFSGLRIVCVHRLADEEMWAAALSAGAADVCSSASPEAILAAVHEAAVEHPTAA
jgi:DNA-binding NarL/FixJ family response regulator